MALCPMPRQTLSDAASVHRPHELDEFRKWMCVHVSIPKEDILALSVTQEYTNK